MPISAEEEGGRRRLKPRQHITQLVAHGRNLLPRHELGALDGVGDADGLLDAARAHPHAPIHAHRNLERDLLAQRGEEVAVRAQQLPVTRGDRVGKGKGRLGGGGGAGGFKPKSVLFNQKKRILNRILNFDPI